MTDRPASVLTVQSEAPPPYSEYDDSHSSVPEPNAETQAMLRGGYRNRNVQYTPQTSVADESPAAVYIRSRAYTGEADELITIARAIHPTIKVEGVPFPNEYPDVVSRDVKPEDWKFFATSIVDELEMPAPKGSVPTPMSVSEFRERQDTIDAVVAQWNLGFFGPRGIHVVPAYSFGRRVPSPTPTYRTSQTGVSEAAEIETVTFDTSPRSSRAHTPDTIRELEFEDQQNGRTTPPAERASFVPTITGNFGAIDRQQSTLEREFQEQLQIDNDLRQQRLAGAGLPGDIAPPPGPPPPHSPAAIAEKLPEKQRRMSAGSSASSTLTNSSIDTLSSDDEIAYGDVPAIRRTLAEEFRRDPTNAKHLRAALASIRDDVKMQQQNMTNTTNKLQRKSMVAASKEHRKAMRAEMKELRREVKSYYKICQIHKKDERDARKQQRKELREALKSSRKEIKGQRKEDRKSRKKGGKRGEKGAPHDDLVPRSGSHEAGHAPWMDAVPGGSSSWPFGKNPSGLPEEQLPAEMPPGWPFGGELPGWPWNEKLGVPKQIHPPNWPLGDLAQNWPLGHRPANWPLGEKPPGWPLAKTASAPVTRKPVPPRRPVTSPQSPDSGSPGPSNAPAPPSPHGSFVAPPAYGASAPPTPHSDPTSPAPYGAPSLHAPYAPHAPHSPHAPHGSHLSPSASFPAASAARAASRSPSPGPAAPAPHFSPFGGREWGGRGRGGRPGADWTGGRGRRWGDRSGSDDMRLGGRGRGRGFGRGRTGSDDPGLIGMARNYLINQAHESIERLRPAPAIGHGPAQRAGSAQGQSSSQSHGDGQETGVAHNG